MSTLLIIELLTDINAEISRELRTTRDPDYKIHLGEVWDLIAKANLLLAEKRTTK